jgi:hypothetical protein
VKNKTLARISAVEARRFLMELANLRDDAGGRFKKLFGDLLPPASKAVFVMSLADNSFRVTTEEEIRQGEERGILDLRNLVRKVWIEPDLRTKRYGVFLLWKWAMFPKGWVEQGIPSSLPPPSPFEQVIQLLIDAADFARYCGNPECVAPYFFASRRNQKYCSDACAKPAQKEFKRQWWAEHGEEWRAARKEASKASRSIRQKTRK